MISELLNYKDLTTKILDELLESYITQNELINKSIITIDLSKLSWDNIVEPYVK